MKHSMVIAGMLSISTISPSAGADTTTISTGGVYGGPQQARAWCYVFNVSAAEGGSLIGAAIIRQDGTTVSIGPVCLPASPHNPNTYLPPGNTCMVWAQLETEQSYGCRWKVSGGVGVKPNLRGTMDIRDGGESVLVSSPLR